MFAWAFEVEFKIMYALVAMHYIYMFKTIVRVCFWMVHQLMHGLWRQINFASGDSDFKFLFYRQLSIRICSLINFIKFMWFVISGEYYNLTRAFTNFASLTSVIFSLNNSLLSWSFMYESSINFQPHMQYIINKWRLFEYCNRRTVYVITFILLTIHCCANYNEYQSICEKFN